MWLTRKLAALASFDRKPKKQEPEPVKEQPQPQKQQHTTLPSFKSISKEKKETKEISKTLPTTTITSTATAATVTTTTIPSTLIVAKPTATTTTETTKLSIKNDVSSQSIATMKTEEQPPPPPSMTITPPSPAATTTSSKTAMTDIQQHNGNIETKKQPPPPSTAIVSPTSTTTTTLGKSIKESSKLKDSKSKKESKKTKESSSSSKSSSKEAKEAKKASKKEAKKEKKEKKESKKKEKKEKKESSKKTKEPSSSSTKKKKKDKSSSSAASIVGMDDKDKESTMTTNTSATTTTMKESKSKAVLTQLRKIKSSSKEKSSSSDAKSTKSSKSGKSMSKSIRTLGSLRGSLRSKASIKSSTSAKTTTSTAASTTTIDPITKPLPPIQLELPTHQVCDKTLVLVISGTLNIGKSTLIRLGLQNLTADPDNATPWQCHRTMFTLDDMHYPMNIIEIDDTMVNTNQDPPEFPEDLGNVHGGLICYDTTNRDSMDCLPDLLNAYVSRNIPSYLVGLKADLSSLRQVDPELGKKLGNLFGVELFEVDAFSEDGTKRMKDIYTMLVKQCVQDHGDEFQSFHAVTTPTTQPVSDNESTITMRERRISAGGEATSLKSRRSTDGLSEYSVNSNNTNNTNEYDHSRRPSFSSETNSVTSDYRFPSLSSKKAAAAQAAASDAESSKPLTGFVYAPTSTTTSTTTATTTVTATATTNGAHATTTTSSAITPETTSTGAKTTKVNDGTTKQQQQINNDTASASSVQVVERKNSLHNTPYARKGLAASRRGSKDSCESMGTGLTIDDLIDKLIVDDPPRSDEHIATIFITFFRRFMKPSDLARNLIDRFDSDGLLEPPPTRIQERIQAILLIWLSNYWNDFHSRRTRKLLTRFLERISKEDVLRPISASLLPLANRMAPDEDPDSHWGMADDDNEELDDAMTDIEEVDDNASDSSDEDVFEECEGTTMDEMEEASEVESTATTSTTTKNKKDSGYSSESFVNFFSSSNTKKDEDSKSISEGCTPTTSHDPAPLKRTASVSSFSLFGGSSRQRKSSITSSLGFLFSFAPMTAAKPADEDEVEEESQRELEKEPVEPKKEVPKQQQKKEQLLKKEKMEPNKDEQKETTTKTKTTSTPPLPVPPKEQHQRSKPSATSDLNSSSISQTKRPSVDVRSINTTTTTATTATNTTNRQPPMTNVNKGNSSRSEFAGGLINIDTHCGMSTSPSWTSFGANTISSSAASFISVFGGGGSVATNNNNHHHPNNNNSSGFRTEKTEKEQINYSYKVMMEIPDQVVAEQLTWIESELFGKIKAREFVRNIWCPRPSSVTSEDQLRCHSAVVASIAHFNFISAWVATIIVTQPKLNKRAGLLEKFMSIAVELRNHNNYNSLMAVLAGLNSASVLRLKQTRDAVSDKKLFKQFQSLERLMSSDRSFSSYRLALKASEAPGIPYLGIHNQDLVSLAEGNKDLRPDGTIHWEKFRLMGECIVAMMKFQCPAYDIEPDGKILHFIADTEILSEDEQYKRSNLVEPRLKSSSTNRLRDLWLRM